MAENDTNVLLERIARELKTIRESVTTAVNYVLNAEAEIPEKMRRFTNYAHDLHSIKYMYEELGHTVPSYINRELERIDDRYRQILLDLHASGGTFDKVLREMAGDPENRWDHTRLLTKQEKVDETGKSDGRRPLGPEEGTDSPRSIGRSG